jgi:hypothetical protein
MTAQLQAQQPYGAESRHQQPGPYGELPEMERPLPGSRNNVPKHDPFAPSADNRFAAASHMAVPDADVGPSTAASRLVARHNELRAAAAAAAGVPLKEPAAPGAERETDAEAAKSLEEKRLRQQLQRTIEEASELRSQQVR